MSQIEKDETSINNRSKSWVKENIRLMSISINACLNDNVSILASGLVYSTLIAVVPFVAFLMAFFSVFGITDQFFNIIIDWLSELLGSSMGDQITELLRVYSTNAMGLGVFGLISFIVTSLFLINKIYAVINEMFHTQPGSGTIRRFSNFFLFLVIGVFLISAIITINTDINDKLSTLTSVNLKLPLWKTILRFVLGYASIWCLLFVFYKYVPNAKVKTKMAIFGANCGFVALLIANLIFKKVIGLTVSYSVIYGSLASVLFMLLFLYIFWFIILVGAKLVYVKQFKPDQSQIQGQPEVPSLQVSESINMLMLICSSYRNGDGPVTEKVIIRKLGISPSLVYYYLQILVKNEIILKVVDKGNAYVPAKPLDVIYVKDVISVLYGGKDVSAETIGEAVAQQFAISAYDTFGNLTIDNLLERI